MTGEAFMGFTIETSISAITVFLQGLLSFFSPCVLPLVPLYLGYLSGGIGAESRRQESKKDENQSGSVGQSGKVQSGHRDGLAGGRMRIFLRVLFFALGISAAFFVLGLGATAAGSFLNENRMLFARIGGVLIILFGLYQMGVFGSSRLLGEEHRIPFHLEKMTMSPVTALIMGFTFSFAWTPCVGPALTSVLLMAGSAQSSAKGFLLIGVYTLGFVLPFLAAGIFTSQLLGFFRKHMKVVRYTVKIGGVLMILMGVLMFTGTMNNITGYLSTVQQAESEGGDTAGTENVADTESAGQQESSAESQTDENSAAASQTENEENQSGNADGSSEENRTKAYDFTLTDQYGNTHTLSDYEGKVIFLNFWGTWCPPCRAEMPDIQKLYEEYASQGDDAEVVILGAAAPGMGQEGSKEEITSFMEENGYTYPVLMDETYEMFNWYGITAFPTTFMIDREGYVYGYVSGQMTEDIMRSIIDQTLSGGK